MIESEAIALASMDQAVARRKLLEFMDIELDFGYVEGLRSTIHATLLHDTFTHAVLKGFTWKDVCRVVQLCQDMLKSLIGKPIVEATKIYFEAALNSGIENRSMAVYTDYFFSTFMQHYKLYQYVFENERDMTVFSSELAIEPPIPPQELKNAKPPHLHEYEQNLREIQSNRQEVKEISPIDSNITVEVDESDLQCPQAEALQKIISKVIQDIGRPLQENISEAISTTYNDLDVKLEETALARPKQLGAPPRYQLKAPLPMPKTTSSKIVATPQQKGSSKGNRNKSGKNK
ncbi:C8orf74 [Bugula neritina]|uniref:C8orf74 n=1 Tax=Bugula neritina TaxID=10212 RepID=A0A7J7KPQ9_BUGNE|nr:C8orf74 [Bugula neritina]